MKKTTSVSKIMSTNLVTLSYDDALTTAEELFETHNIRHIPIIRSDEIVGILSHTDLMRVNYIQPKEDHDAEVEVIFSSIFTIEQVMTKNVITISSCTNIEEVALIFSKNDFHALPIVDKGDLVGIVTTTDLINVYLQTCI